MEVPLFQVIFTPYDPSFMVYFGVIFLANMGGGGGQNYFHRGSRQIIYVGSVFSTRNNQKGGTASLRSRTRLKRNAVFGARFKGLSLYFLYQKGNLIRIKTGLDT